MVLYAVVFQVGLSNLFRGFLPSYPRLSSVVVFPWSRRVRVQLRFQLEVVFSIYTSLVFVYVSRVHFFLYSHFSRLGGYVEFECSLLANGRGVLSRYGFREYVGVSQGTIIFHGLLMKGTSLFFVFFPRGLSYFLSLAYVYGARLPIAVNLFYVDVSRAFWPLFVYVHRRRRGASRQ